MQDEKNVAPKKLTASVAPLVKSQPSHPKQVHTLSTVPLPNSAQVNPILLLPVSLQANQGPGAQRSEMGALSLVTLQASPDLFNCFGLCETGTSSTDSQKPWNCCKMPITTAFVDRLNSKVGNSPQVQNPKDCVFTEPIVAPQSEPLNLKMGETTIPSFKHNSTTSKIAFVQPLNSSSTSIQSRKIASLVATNNHCEITEQFQKKNPIHLQLLNRTKLKRRKRTGSINLRVSDQQVVTLREKSHAICPSPGECYCEEITSTKRT